MPSTAPRPPFSIELLADLHAGGIPPEEAEQLWPRVRTDPDAKRYLDSLDEIDTRLRELAHDEHTAHPMPAGIAARLTEFIDTLDTENTPPQRISEHFDTPPAVKGLATVHRLAVAPPPVTRSAQPTTPSTTPIPTLEDTIYDTDRLGPNEFEDPLVSLDTEPDYSEQPDARPSRRLRWITAAAAVAAVVTGSVVAVDAIGGRTVAPRAQPVADARLDTDLPAKAVLSFMGRHEITGPLATGNALSACLKAAGLDRPILGSRSVVYSGGPGVLVLLPGPKPPQITAVVVGSTCGPDNPEVLGRNDIG